MKDVIVIGAGPAGFTAALYAVRSGMDVLVLEKGMYGGQAVDSPEIDNIPGFLSVRGAEFAMKLYEQVKAQGVEIKQEEVKEALLQGEVKKVKTKQREYESKTVILANGLKRRLLGCPGEKEFSGKGVSYCATCDGAFYKGKEVFLIGGGNTALEDALFLSNYCGKVTVVHRRNEFRAAKTYVDAILKKENVSILYDSEVVEIKGNSFVDKVVIKNKNTHNIMEHPADGVFISIGFEPNNEWLKGQLDLTDHGYYRSGEDCTTKLEGVFVAGDCREKPLRQIVTAASDGAVAGFGAAGYITMGKILNTNVHE